MKKAQRQKWEKEVKKPLRLVPLVEWKVSGDMLRDKYYVVGRHAMMHIFAGKAKEFKFNAMSKREPVEGPKGVTRSA